MTSGASRARFGNPLERPLPFTLAPSAGFFGNIGDDFDDGTWAHFPTSSTESQSFTCPDPLDDLRHESDVNSCKEDGKRSRITVSGEDEISAERSQLVSDGMEASRAGNNEGMRFTEADKNGIFAESAEGLLISSSLPPAKNFAAGQLNTDGCGPSRSPKEIDFERLHNLYPPEKTIATSEMADLHADSESSSLHLYHPSDATPHLTKEDRALRRRVFHKVHTRRSRAKLNEKLDHLRLILPTPPIGTCVKSKAQILDWAIACASAQRFAPQSITSVPKEKLQKRQRYTRAQACSP